MSEQTLKKANIIGVEYTYLKNYLGLELYEDLYANRETYTDFLENYAKDFLAWAVLYENFENLAHEIGDKGIYQINIEGGQIITDTTKAKKEILKLLLRAGQRMIDKAKEYDLYVEQNVNFRMLNLVTNKRMFVNPF